MNPDPDSYTDLVQGVRGAVPALPDATLRRLEALLEQILSSDETDWAALEELRGLVGG